MVVTDYNEQFLDKRGTDHLIEELKAYINGISTGDIDLSNYVTNEQLQEALKNAGVDVDLSAYATKEELFEAINNIDLSSYAKKTDIPTVPTKVSELENDSGYLTEHQDLSDYAKKTDLHSHTNKNVLDGITSTKVSNWNSAKTHADSAHAPSTAQPNIIETVKVNGASLSISDKAVNIDLSSYAKKTDIPSTKGLATTEYVDNAIANVPTTDLTGYATEEYVSTAINSIPKTDLTDYAKTSDIPTKVSQLENDNNYLSSIPEEYVTETQLDAKGYLTQHQDLSSYALKTDIPDVSSFQTETQVNALIDAKLGVIENGTY